ncbi:12007_t:CDS:2 [Funneliformis mosseae]|uniref:12007_t:CDS:1 n=1 Tax=Funneliformis mosseae TaxID=27381 RepID=A0A9N9BNT9_FUNMO|nr:12007_t:CDS:2 [Funneliformis mosseae]
MSSSKEEKIDKNLTLTSTDLNTLLKQADKTNLYKFFPPKNSIQSGNNAIDNLVFKLNFIRTSQENGNHFIKIYGITQDINTKDYMIVMQYAEQGSLRQYLKRNYKNLKWYNKLNLLSRIASSISDMHKILILHRDLHPGNILKEKDDVCLSDTGLNGSCDNDQSNENLSKEELIIKNEFDVSNELISNLPDEINASKYREPYISKIIDFTNLPTPVNL